jgi:hypothetical protein
VRSRRLAACTLAFGLVATGCGGGSSIDRQASQQLAGAVARVRAAARAHDVAGARARLDDVRRMLALLRARGDVSDAAARRILAAADAVGTDLRLIPTTTTTSTSTTTTTPPRRPPPNGKKDHHGRAKGDGGNGD